MTIRARAQRYIIVSLAALVTSGLLYAVAHVYAENPSYLYSMLQGAGVTIGIWAYAVLLVYAVSVWWNNGPGNKPN